MSVTDGVYGVTADIRSYAPKSSAERVGATGCGRSREGYRDVACRVPVAVHPETEQRTPGPSRIVDIAWGRIYSNTNKYNLN